MITRLYFRVPKEAPPAGSVQGLEHALAAATGGFTAYAGTGVWQDPATLEYVEELSYIYEIVHDGVYHPHGDVDPHWKAVREFALAMKVLLKQPEVLMVHIQAEKEVL